MLLRAARLSVIAIVAVIVSCGGSRGVADDGMDAGTGGDSGASGGSSTGGSVTGGATSGGASSSSGGGGDLGGSGPSSELDCVAAGDGRTTLVLENRCAGALTYAGSDIPGGTLAQGASSCVDLGSDEEELSAKRYWGFVGQDPGAEHHSLAEFTFNTDFYDFDWYNISFVDAFNLPMQIVPLAKPDCDPLTCAEDLLPDCPSVGRYVDGTGSVVSCVSPERDDASSPVAVYFEQCDDAYAWSGDDQQGDDPSPVKACAGEDWLLVFCPEQ